MAAAQQMPRGLPPGMGPVMVLNTKQQRQTGRPAQLGNIAAAQTVASLVRTTLGPRSMLKMLLDPMGSLVLTNDGHCILREVDVSHPTAKSLLEVSRSQDEEVGDGTTSVIVLTAEVLGQAAAPWLRGSGLVSHSTVHPTVLIQAMNLALQKALEIVEQHCIAVNLADAVPALRQAKTSKDNDAAPPTTENPNAQLVRKLVESSLGTKFSSRWNSILVDMALQAVLTVADTETSSLTTSPSSAAAAPPSHHHHQQRPNVDLKRYAKVEKIPGGEMEDCCVLRGVMLQKDVTHSAMRRRIAKPRILLLDTPLEYKKGESQTTLELTADDEGGGATDFEALLKLEEDYVAQQCAEIIALQPDIVITEKGVSDLAQHFLTKANITAFRRVRKTDNNRIARAVGATIVSRTDEATVDDLGTGCGLFEMRQISNDWFCYLTDCDAPKACTIVLRGGSKDVLNEVERNLQDAMQVVRNIVYEPKLVCGGGATEMAVSVGLTRAAKTDGIPGILQGPFAAVGQAMEVIPRTLAQNCGVSVIRTLTQLRAKHAAAADAAENAAPCTWGIHGITGELVDMREYGVYEPYTVKVQTLKTAIETACMILRIDDIVSGSKKKNG